jgi:hypothetical protein
VLDQRRVVQRMRQIETATEVRTLVQQCVIQTAEQHATELPLEPDVCIMRTREELPPRVCAAVSIDEANTGQNDARFVLNEHRIAVSEAVAASAQVRRTAM